MRPLLKIHDLYVGRVLLGTVLLTWAVLVGLEGVAPHYQLVVERRGSLDELTIEVETAGAMPEGAMRNVERVVAHHVKSMIGVSAAVVAKKPGEVPRSQGKAVRVRDLRPKDV